jgi:hypothetical protein
VACRLCDISDSGKAFALVERPVGGVEGDQQGVEGVAVAARSDQSVAAGELGAGEGVVRQPEKRVPVDLVGQVQGAVEVATQGDEPGFVEDLALVPECLTALLGGAASLVQGGVDPVPVAEVEVDGTLHAEHVGQQAELAALAQAGLGAGEVRRGSDLVADGVGGHTDEAEGVRIGDLLGREAREPLAHL